MPSPVTPSIEDYDNWHRQTLGGIRYRFLETSGSFTYDDAAVTWSAIFRTEDLYALMAEMFPPPVQYGNISIPVRTYMPGANLAAKKASFRSHMDGKPIDPFAADSGAIGGTYHPYIIVDVDFETINAKDSDPDDPRTFLEISSTAGGEFIYAPPSNTLIVDERNANGAATGEVVDDDTVVGGGVVEDDTLKPTSNIRLGTTRVNPNPITPSTILVPSTDWTLRWRQIPADLFRNVIIWRLRTLRGRVNRTPLSLLYNAPPETLLFTGFSYTEAYTWRNGFLDSPPIDVEIKIIEKAVIWNGAVVGHNHVWEPGVGWQRMYLSDGSNPYRAFDFNYLFRR